MYPGGHLRRIAGLYGASEFPPRMYHSETRNASYLAVARGIIIFVNVAFIDGEIRKLFQEKVPFDAFAGTTPGCREVY
jgi:hypothetical protein